MSPVNGQLSIRSPTITKRTGIAVSLPAPPAPRYSSAARSSEPPVVSSLTSNGR